MNRYSKIVIALIAVMLAACVKKPIFTDVIIKPSWWDTVGASILKTEADVDSLWQSKEHCGVDKAQVELNNREFYKSCYQTIAMNPADDHVTVKCLWLMDIAADEAERIRIKEYLLDRYFNHKASTYNCVNCSAGDIVARVSNDLSTYYEWKQRKTEAITVLEKVIDTRRGEISLWIQAELYSHLGKLYLLTGVTRERQKRLDDAYSHLFLIKDNETLTQRFSQFERVYREVKARL